LTPKVKARVIGMYCWPCRLRRRYFASPSGAQSALTRAVAAGGRHQGAVAAVARPAERQRHRGAGLAELGLVVGVAERQVAAADLGALDADAEEHRVVLAERHAEANRGARGDELVFLALAVDRLGRAVVDVERARDAVDREVGIDRADDERLVVLAGVDLEAEVVARAEDVLLLDRGGERELVGRRIAGADEIAPVAFSLTVIVRSTWSGVPGTSLLSTLTSLK
jgi:hypothetical protein